MVQPLITAWTVMPFKIVAKAWTDSAFKTALLGGSGNDVLRAALWEYPWNFSTTITEETGSDRYLVLPELPSAYDAWTEEQVLNQLIAETFGDLSLQYYLPARVIDRALFDSNFKTDLLNDADTALASMGSSVLGGQTFNVLENSGNSINLVLPKIPLDWNGLTYNELLQRLFAQGQQTMMAYTATL